MSIQLRQVIPRPPAMSMTARRPVPSGPTMSAMPALSVGLGAAGPLGWVCHMPTKPTRSTVEIRVLVTISWVPSMP